MEDRWFVYAEGSHSIKAVREAGYNDDAHFETVLNRNREIEKDVKVFDILFSDAKGLRRSVLDGGQPWKFRFFRLSANMIHPTEDDPTKDEKKSRKIEATKRAVRAAQKARAGRR